MQIYDYRDENDVVVCTSEMKSSSKNKNLQKLLLY